MFWHLNLSEIENAIDSEENGDSESSDGGGGGGDDMKIDKLIAKYAGKPPEPMSMKEMLKFGIKPPTPVPMTPFEMAVFGIAPPAAPPAPPPPVPPPVSYELR